MADQGRSPTRRQGSRIPFQAALLLSVLAVLSACLPRTAEPTSVVTPTTGATPTLPPTPTPTPQAPYLTYAHGEILPDMRVPIQRNASGEGGWYTIIGTQEGWAQFLSQMGQPAQIWEPVSWGQEILVGALLGIRGGRGHTITISDLEISGITVQVTVAYTAPAQEPDPTWIAYPFHLIRLSRDELPLGPVTFEFLSTEGQLLVSQEIDMTDLNIAWLPGEDATYPTPTPPPSTSTPEPTSTATPVPNQQTTGTILEVVPEKLELRLLPDRGEWQYIVLMEASSILSEDGQPTTFAQLQPGMAISVLGYTGADGRTRAAHVDIVRQATEGTILASYQPRDVSLSTLYDGYVLPLPFETLSATIPVTLSFGLSQTQALTQSGFVVVPDRYPSFAALYQDQEANDLPVFVSADAVLHVTEAVLGNTLYTLEREHLLPELTMLDRQMFEVSWSQYEEAASNNSAPESARLISATLRNAAYFAVPLSLLDPAFTAPAAISAVVEAEVALISAGKAITVSPLLDLPDLPEDERQQVDYAQFAPPTRYVQDTGLDGYYQALTWHRSIAFRPTEREETRSAALIAFAMQTDSIAKLLWERLQTVIGAFQGRDASLSPADYGELLAGILTEDATMASLADPAVLDGLQEAIPLLPLPDNTIWELAGKSNPPTRNWRFFSQPFRLDDYVFERTTDAPVAERDNQRTLPSLLDLTLALGSIESYRIASEEGDSQGPYYLDRIGQVRNDLMALQLTDWTQDVQTGWLYACRAMIADKTPSYPQWMRTASWQRKELQTVFSGWTSLRHNTEGLPVLSESAATDESGLPAERWGYVEPQPETYARLAALVSMVIEGMEQRLLLPGNRNTLVELESWLSFLQDAARRELTGQALSNQEYARLANIGPLLQRTVGTNADVNAVLSIAADDTSRQMEGVGLVDTIYVVIERDRQQYLARGGVYSHYEFTWPLAQVLTDPAWEEMLSRGQAPARPAWVQGFVLE